MARERNSLTLTMLLSWDRKFLSIYLLHHSLQLFADAILDMGTSEGKWHIDEVDAADMLAIDDLNLLELLS